MLKVFKLIVPVILLWSCSNEIKITSPWKETIIVYGLLDPAATNNYIRIQKAYLDPAGNAYQFADNSDSIYPGPLEVKLLVRKNGDLINTLFPSLIDGALDGIKKDSGLFANSPNYLYKISEPILASRLITGGREDYEYELKIKNKATGYECSAKTGSTGLLEALSPVGPGSTDISIADKNNSYMTIYYREGRNVKTYDLVLRFWYEEMLVSDTSKKTLKSMDWVLFKNKATKSIEGYNTQLLSISGSIFYQILQATILPNPNIKRRGLYCDFEFYGAAEDLYTFIQVNQPALGVVQKKPEYSNINNGLGLFSSRYITAIKKIPLSDDFKFLLKTSDYTKGLNF